MVSHTKVEVQSLIPVVRQSISEEDTKPQVIPVYDCAWGRPRWGRHCHYRVSMWVRVNADQYITFMLQLVNHFVTLKKQGDRTPSVISQFSSLNLHVYTQSLIFWGLSAGLGLASPALFLQEPYLSHHPCFQTVLFSQPFPPQLHFFLFINTQHAGSERSRASCLSHQTSCLANILWSDALTPWISHVGSPSMNLKLLLSNLTRESHCDVLQRSFAAANITAALDNDGPVCSKNRIFRSTFSHIWIPSHQTGAVGPPRPCPWCTRSLQ